MLQAAAAALAVMVVGATGALAADRFGDVVSDHPHADGIGFAVASGVTAGCRDGSDYCPDAVVSRDQMATFLHRLSGHASGVDASVDAATVGGLSAAQLQSGEVDLDPLLDRLDALEADNADLSATVADLEVTVADLEAHNADFGVAVADLEAENDGLQALLAGVERADDDNGYDTLTFSGMNVQVVDGDGAYVDVLDPGRDPNGLGNLIVGYNEESVFAGDSERTGSHNLVVGTGHAYTDFGGLVAGRVNTVSGMFATVTGGASNTAEGPQSSVSGGESNLASGGRSTVSGGRDNTASGTGSSVSGGDGNTASGNRSSVSGGVDNTASGGQASVSGGLSGQAGGPVSSILGGFEHEVTVDFGLYPRP